MTDLSLKTVDRLYPFDDRQDIEILYGEGWLIEDVITTLEVELDGPRPVLSDVGFQLHRDPDREAEVKEHQRVLDARRARAWPVLKSLLLREVVTAVGWRNKAEDGYPIPERIPRRFWMDDAWLRPNFNLARTHSVSYYDVKLLRSSAREATASESTVPTATPPEIVDVSKLSKPEIRELAIHGCASPNQIAWWQKSKEDRRSGYRDYLVSKTGFDPVRAYGYGPDTWEADEIKYKHKHGLIQPKSLNR